MEAGQAALAAFNSLPPEQRSLTDGVRAVMEEIATTGCIRYKWSLVRPVLALCIQQTLERYHEAEVARETVGPPPRPPDVQFFVSALEMFEDEAPWTIQRICELLRDPEKTYKRLHKLMNALDKLLIVTSTCPQTLPGGARPDGRAPSAGPRGAAGWGPDGGAAKGFSLIVPTGAVSAPGPLGVRVGMGVVAPAPTVAEEAAVADVEAMLQQIEKSVHAEMAASGSGKGGGGGSAGDRAAGPGPLPPLVAVGGDGGALALGVPTGNGMGLGGSGDATALFTFGQFGLQAARVSMAEGASSGPGSVGSAPGAAQGATKRPDGATAAAGGASSSTGPAGAGNGGVAGMGQHAAAGAAAAAGGTPPLSAAGPPLVGGGSGGGGGGS